MQELSELVSLPNYQFVPVFRFSSSGTKIFYKMMTKSSFGNNDDPPFYSVDSFSKLGESS